MEAVKICEHCECKFYNKNKVFCSRECQIEHMKLKICQGCGQPKIKEDDNRFYCSNECKEKHSKSMLQYNLETILNLGWMCKNNFELLQISYSFKNLDTNKEYTQTIDFKE